MRRIPRRGAAVVAVLALASAAGVLLARTGSDDASAPAADRPTTSGPDGPTGGRPDADDVGAPGVGDPYFPEAGNGGYDVGHYDLDLTWLADEGVLEGVTTVRATATQGLVRFDLDLVGLEVASVEVDDRPATFERAGRELVITPAEPISDGDAFATTVTYRGRPTTVEDGTDIFDPGWQIDGREAFVVSEPLGAATFFPSNDHPSDKATYTIDVTAPADQTVAANGLLAAGSPSESGRAGYRSWTYDAPDPMATYLVQVAIGDYELVDGGQVDGVPLRHAFHRGAPRPQAVLDATADQIRFLSEIFGPFPFTTYGVLAVDVDLGFALETQTLTIVPAAIVEPGILLHELAHQWVGDSVSIASWKDIWLNEGMATYAEWLWSERNGGRTAAEIGRALRNPELTLPAGDPGPDELFPPSVYDRGALTLQALREAVGDEVFFDILRRWTTEHAGASVTTADFVELAERRSGQQLDELFRTWLSTVTLPRL